MNNHYNYKTKIKGLDELTSFALDFYMCFNLISPIWGSYQNKGFFDTLGKDLVSIVSLHAMTLELPKSHLLTGNNKPVILCNGKLYYPSNCSLFLTHNDLETAKQLLTLHNNGYNILIGAYGSLEERYLWFKMLEELKRENDSLKFECDSLNDDYYAFITSTHKTKRKILTR